MDLSEEDRTAIRNRLRRAAGQLNGVLRMIEEGKDCDEIITQLAACSKAIDRAGFSIMVCGVQSCVQSDDPAEDRSARINRLEKLFMSLS